MRVSLGQALIVSVLEQKEDLDLHRERDTDRDQQMSLTCQWWENYSCT